MFELSSNNQSPASGKWVWKDDPLNPSLEFESTFPNADKQDKRRRAKGSDGKGRGDRATSGVHRAGMLGKGRTTLQKYQKPAVATKKKQNEHLTVTLEDIKNVSLERMAEVYPISVQFEYLYTTERFDSCILHLLSYFNCFFNKMALDNKKNMMYIESSKAEKLEYANVCERLAMAQKLLGGAYSLLLLGLEVEDQHHMECGRSRVSKTYSDRSLFETFYNFCTFVVWITFHRKEFDCVKKEIGRLLRSDTFNPALRVKNTPTEAHDVDPTISKKDETIEEKKATDVREKKLTQAEYRRLYQTRPAIRSIINQRSPAIVSILPSPKEEAYWLFQRPKLNESIDNSVLRNTNDESTVDEKFSDLIIDDISFCAGILGEPYKQFNPQTLTPLGAENEEEGNEAEDGEKGLSEGEGDKEMKSQSSELGLSRQQTGISRATTEAFTDDDL